MKFHKLFHIKISFPEDAPVFSEPQLEEVRLQIRKAIKYQCNISLSTTVLDLKRSEQKLIEPNKMKLKKLRIFIKKFKLKKL